MKHQLYTDVDGFAGDCFDFLSGSDQLEIENNLSLGLLERLQKREYDSPYMIAVRNNNSNIIFAALLTPPFNLVLARGETKAIPLIINDIRKRNLTIPGIIGPEDMTDAFAAEWNKDNRKHLTSFLKMAFYTITNVKIPKQVPGAFRKAEEGDQIWLTDWLAEFAKDAGLSEHEQKINPKNTSRKINTGLLYIWEKDSVPVSIAGYTPVTKNGVRIGSVYTPLPERGKGYASACVAHLSQHVLDNGRRWASLFADTSNPISTGIYKKIGYKEQCMYNEYRLKQ